MRMPKEITLSLRSLVRLCKVDFVGFIMPSPIYQPEKLILTVRSYRSYFTFELLHYLLSSLFSFKFQCGGTLIFSVYEDIFCIHGFRIKIADMFVFLIRIMSLSRVMSL